MKKRSTSGKRNRRRVEPVGAQSTTHTSNSPVASTSFTARSATSSSMPGKTSSSSATISSACRRASAARKNAWISDQDRSSSARRRRPSCATTFFATSTGRGPDRRDPGRRRRCAPNPWTARRPDGRGRAAPRAVADRHARLADAALAGVQQHAHVRPTPTGGRLRGRKGDTSWSGRSSRAAVAATSGMQSDAGASSDRRRESVVMVSSSSIFATSRCFGSAWGTGTTATYCEPSPLRRAVYRGRRSHPRPGHGVGRAP